MSKGKETGNFHTYICNLCLADGLMGVYLLIIGIADYHYSGVYIFHDEEWKTSGWCQLAGFLCLLSSEVSAFTICLITHDRYLVVRFPFSQGSDNSKRPTIVSCAVLWCFGILLAAIPLLPATSHWEYYSQTGVCMPLPFTTGISVIITFCVLFFIIVCVIICLPMCSTGKLYILKACAVRRKCIF